MQNEIISTSSNRFELSNDGWRRMNAGREPKHLVREAVSNALDQADVTAINVDLNFTGVGVEVTVSDNSPTGIESPEHVTTIFMTGKEDSPTSRGRKGRGVKELISAAKTASIETIGFTVNFDEGRTVVKNTRKRGTKVVAYVDGWGQDCIKEITDYLSSFIVNPGVALFIDGVRVKNRKPRTTILSHLETVQIKDGVQSATYRTCDVELYSCRPDEPAFLYELGVPVTSLDTPFHINVGQRIPLSDDRTSVSGYYTRTLLSLCLDGVVDTWSKKELKEKWVEEALIYASHSCRTKYVTALFGDVSKAVVKSTNRVANASLAASGYNVVDTANMARSVAEAIQAVLPNAEVVAEVSEQNDAGEVVESHTVDPDAKITAFMTVAVEKLAGAEPTVEFRKFKPTAVHVREPISIINSTGGTPNVIIDASAFPNADLSKDVVRALIKAVATYRVSVDRGAAAHHPAKRSSEVTLDVAAEVATMLYENSDVFKACL